MPCAVVWRAFDFGAFDAARFCKHAWVALRYSMSIPLLVTGDTSLPAIGEGVGLLRVTGLRIK